VNGGTVADADKSVSATAEKVEDQTKVVSNAEKTATATANKVADAQKKVDALSSTTDVAFPASCGISVNSASLDACLLFTLTVVANSP